MLVASINRQRLYSSLAHVLSFALVSWCFRTAPSIADPEFKTLQLSDIDQIVLASDGVVQAAREALRLRLQEPDASLTDYSRELWSGVGNGEEATAYKERCEWHSQVMADTGELIRTILWQTRGQHPEQVARSIVQATRGVKPDDLTVITVQMPRDDHIHM